MNIKELNGNQFNLNRVLEITVAKQEFLTLRLKHRSPLLRFALAAQPRHRQPPRPSLRHYAATRAGYNGCDTTAQSGYIQPTAEAYYP